MIFNKNCKYQQCRIEKMAAQTDYHSKHIFINSLGNVTWVVQEEDGNTQFTLNGKAMAQLQKEENEEILNNALHIANYFHGFWNSEVQCRIHKRSPIIAILTRINPIPPIDAHLFKIHSNKVNLTLLEERVGNVTQAKVRMD